MRCAASAESLTTWLTISIKGPGVANIWSECQFLSGLFQFDIFRRAAQRQLALCLLLVQPFGDYTAILTTLTRQNDTWIRSKGRHLFLLFELLKLLRVRLKATIFLRNFHLHVHLFFLLLKFRVVEKSLVNGDWHAIRHHVRLVHLNIWNVTTECIWNRFNSAQIHGETALVSHCFWYLWNRRRFQNFRRIRHQLLFQKLASVLLCYEVSPVLDHRVEICN